jgi:hypothetical protein
VSIRKTKLLYYRVEKLDSCGVKELHLLVPSTKTRTAFLDLYKMIRSASSKVKVSIRFCGFPFQEVRVMVSDSHILDT